jgi:hypothetical protein
MVAPINITAAGAAGTHTVRKVNVNAEDNYVYFKDTGTASTIPNTITQGTGYIYGQGVGEVSGITDGGLVFADIVSPTQVRFTTESNGATVVDITSSVAGSVSFNTPVVFDERLNIDASTPTNQAVKYYTSGTPLTGLTSGETYFLKNVSVSDFAGQQALYTLTDVSIATSQAQYVSPGTFSWTAPVGVYEVSVVAVGGGGGGARGNVAASGAGGGGLGWKNNIAVTPGQSYTVVVGAGGSVGTNVGGNGGDSWFITSNTVRGGGGLGALASSSSNRAGGTFVGDGGGNGGIGAGRRNNDSAGGGGGAGGYTGNGGAGGGISSNSQAGAGGGGGGGGFAGPADTAGAGGGVGILGQGANGGAGTNSNSDGGGGGGGSGGGNASRFGTNVGDVYSTNARAFPGAYGGGASGGDNTASYEVDNGGGGAVRIIWGPNRAFPSTGTGNL